MTEFEDIFGIDLYSVLFHYSFYKKAWFCFNRSEGNYFNGDANVGKGETIEEAFLDYMNKYQPDKIEKYKGEKL